MPLSRYTVLPQQQVLNTYARPDLQYAAAALGSKQKAYDEGQAFDEAQDGAFGKFAVRNVDISRRDQLHDEYVQKAQDLVSTKYQGDYGAALPELRKLATATAGNEFFSRATQALGRQKDMYETEKAIQKKGGTSLGFNRDAYSKAVYNDDGTYNDVDYDVQERLDWSKPKMDLMKDIAKDTRLTGLSATQIGGVLQHGSMKGVDAGKVIGVAKQMLAPYLSTPEGQQELRYYLHNGATQEQAMGSMLRSLGGIGSKQVGHDLDMDYLTDPAYLYRLKKADKAAEAAKQLLDGPEFQTGMMTNPNAPEKIELDEKGRAYVPDTRVSTEDAYSVDPLSSFSSPASVQGYRDYDKASKRVGELRSSYNKVHKGETGYNANISDKELVRLHNKAVENSGEVAFKGTQLMPKAAEATSAMILGPNWKKGDVSGLQGRLVMPVNTTGKGGKLVTLPEAMEEMGLGKDSKISSANVVGRNPYAPVSGAYTVRLTVTDAHGQNPQHKEILVSGSQQEQDFQGQFQPLIDAALAGKPGRVDVGSIHLRSVSAPGKDGKFHHQIRKYEILPNGEYIPLRERNKDGSIKKGANGRPVYVQPQSLDGFTKDMYSVFQKANPDLFNVAGYTAKDDKEDVRLPEEED